MVMVNIKGMKTHIGLNSDYTERFHWKVYL